MNGLTFNFNLNCKIQFASILHNTNISICLHSFLLVSICLCNSSYCYFAGRLTWSRNRCCRRWGWWRCRTHLCRRWPLPWRWNPWPIGRGIASSACHGHIHRVRVQLSHFSSLGKDWIVWRKRRTLLHNVIKDVGAKTFTWWWWYMYLWCVSICLSVCLFV